MFFDILDYMPEKKYFLFLFLSPILLFLPFFVLAKNSVVINEINWAGSKNSSGDEWIELYNNTDKDIDLKGWTLKAEDKTPEINLIGTIPAQDYYLLERTDDNSAPNAPADQLYKGSLENSGEDLKLYDETGNLIDEVNCSSGWFAGNNESKLTMEKINPEFSGNEPSSWQASAMPGGTPKFENKKTGSENNLENKEQLAISSGGIQFSEIMPNPDGPDTENEWIKIKNQNNFEVDLTGWKIKDTVGTTTVYVFPKNSKLAANSEKTLSRAITKIILNNDGDKLELLTPKDEIIDTVNYEAAPKNQRYIRSGDTWAWSGNETAAANKPAVLAQEQKVSGVIKTVNSNEPGGETAELGKKISQNFVADKIAGSDKFAAIFISMILAILSSTIILLLKKSLKTEKY